MTWSLSIRALHRWVSVLFAAIVGALFVTLGLGGEPPEWVYLLPLAPLALLLATGLYLFGLPYAARRRSHPRRERAQPHAAPAEKSGR